MVFGFHVVGLAQADHMNFVMTWREDHGMNPYMNDSKHLKATFSVISAGVFLDQIRTPFQNHHERERQASLRFIVVTFCWIKADVLIHL